MRGISGVVRAAGGRFPIGGGGPGKRGATRFTPRTGSGSVSFSSASAPASSAPGQGGVILKAAVTCAGLGIVGDVLAQTITNRSTAKAAKASTNKKGAKGTDINPSTPLDMIRTARQCAYNFVFYGPAQHFWYGALAGYFPTNAAASLAANFRPFAAKVFLNQAVLGPVVVTTFFAWTFALQGKMGEYPGEDQARHAAHAEAGLGVLGARGVGQLRGRAPQVPGAVHELLLHRVELHTVHRGGVDGAGASRRG
jgi:protein Mpv17